MAQKPRARAASKTIQRSKPRCASLAEPFHPVLSAAVTRDDARVKVPTIVLRGEWLKAAGFPIGSMAYVTTDHRGEIALHRLGLGVPRRLYVRARR